MRSSLLVSQLVHQHAWVLDPSIRKQISLNAFSAAMENQLMSGAGGVNGIFDKRGQYSIYKSSSPIVIPVSAQDNDLGSQNDADNPLLGCVKEHFGLMAGTTTLAVAGMPISKKMLGHPVVERSSQYTNLTSHFGNKFFPRKVLASPTYYRQWRNARQARFVYLASLVVFRQSWQLDLRFMIFTVSTNA